MSSYQIEIKQAFSPILNAGEGEELRVELLDFSAEQVEKNSKRRMPVVAVCKKFKLPDKEDGKQIVRAALNVAYGVACKLHRMDLD